MADHHLAYVCNLGIKTNLFPEKLKEAKVTPLFIESLPLKTVTMSVIIVTIRDDIHL